MKTYKSYKQLRNKYYGFTIPVELLWNNVRELGYEPDEDNGAKEHELRPQRREKRQLAINAALRKILIDAKLYLKPLKFVPVKVKGGYYWWMIAMAYEGPCEEELLLTKVPADEEWADLKAFLQLKEDTKPDLGLGPRIPCIPQGKRGYKQRRNEYFGFTIPFEVFWEKVREMGYEPDEDNGAKEFDLLPERREQRQLAVNVALRKMLIDANLHLKPAKAVRVKVRVENETGYWWMVAMAYRGRCEEGLLLKAIPPNEVWTDLKRLLGLKEGDMPEWGLGPLVPPCVLEHDF